MDMPGTLDSRAKDLIDKGEETFKTICVHVASGGSLIDLCEMWAVRYGDMIAWIRSDKEMSRRYSDAMNDRGEWAKERILLELKRIGMADIRKIYNEDGSLKAVHEWPSEVAGFVASIETVEEFEGSGKDKEQVGWNKKVKLWNKERALELLGKNLHLFIEKVEHSGKLTLEDLVNATREDDDASKKETDG